MTSQRLGDGLLGEAELFQQSFLEKNGTFRRATVGAVGFKGLEAAEAWIYKYSDLKIESELGRGAFGVVYKGRLVGEVVAIKQLHMGVQEKSDVIRHEINIMRRLKHPNIVQFLGATLPPDPMCIITELVGRGTLAKFIMDESNKYNRDMVQSLALDIARGMDHLHRSGVIHQDLNPNNILLTDDLHCKVSDFGLSKLTSGVSKSVTNRGGGTVAFTAPEIYRCERITSKVDVYSFAICLWQITYRKQPYPGMLQHAICYNVVALDLRPEMSEDDLPEFADVIEACWNPDPAQRPSFHIIARRFEVSQRRMQQQQKPQSPPLSGVTVNVVTATPIPSHNGLNESAFGLAAVSATQPDVKDDPRLWTEDQVVAWLLERNMGWAIPVIKDNDVTGRVLLTLSDSDLKELGITSFGHRRLLQVEVTKLKERMAWIRPQIGNSPSTRRYHSVDLSGQLSSQRRSSIGLDTHGSTRQDGEYSAPLRSQSAVSTNRPSTKLDFDLIATLISQSADGITSDKVPLTPAIPMARPPHGSPGQKRHRLARAEMGMSKHTECCVCHRSMHTGTPAYQCLGCGECAHEQCSPHMPACAAPSANAHSSIPCSPAQPHRTELISPAVDVSSAAEARVFGNILNDSITSLTQSQDLNESTEDIAEGDTISFCSNTSTSLVRQTASPSIHGAHSNSTTSLHNRAPLPSPKVKPGGRRSLTSRSLSFVFNIVGSSKHKKKPTPDPNFENIIGKVLMAKHDGLTAYNHERYRECYKWWSAEAAAVCDMCTDLLDSCPPVSKDYLDIERKPGDPYTTSLSMDEMSSLRERLRNDINERNFALFATLVRTKLQSALRKASDKSLGYHTRATFFRDAFDFVLGIEGFVASDQPPSGRRESAPAITGIAVATTNSPKPK